MILTTPFIERGQKRRDARDRVLEFRMLPTAMTGLVGMDQAVIDPMTEAQWANVLRRQGQRVMCHRGRYWTETVKGFYEPVHWLAALSDEQATRPRLGWGFRASLTQEASGCANAAMPIHLCSSVADYEEEFLPSKRRNDLRRCRKRIQIVQLRDARLLKAQGRAVVVSALGRTGHDLAPSPAEYDASVHRLVENPHMVVLAGLADGVLTGYLTGYAISDVAYVQSVFLATQFLNTAVGTGLPFEFVQMCRRAGTVQRVVYGLHSVEDSSLSAFKAGMGFPTVLLPARVSMLPGVRWLLRCRFPYKLYRLTGEYPPTPSYAESVSAARGER